MLSGAAAGEPALAALYERAHANRHQNLTVLAAQIASNGPLRMDEDAAAETIWALVSPELHTLLTGVRGWTRERYEAWLADALTTLLLPAK